MSKPEKKGKIVGTLMGSEYKMKKCKVDVLERWDVLTKKRKKLKRKSSANRIQCVSDFISAESSAVAPSEKPSSSGLSGQKENESSKTKEKKKKKKTEKDTVMLTDVPDTAGAPSGKSLKIVFRQKEETGSETKAKKKKKKIGIPRP